LIEMGVEKGDRVAMLLPNCPEFVIIYFGIAKIGGIVVPLNIRYKIEELVSLLNDSQPKVLMAESHSLELLIPALPRFGYIEHIIDLDDKYPGQFISYHRVMTTSSARRVEVALEPEDTALIIYTSSPTVNPRGVALSHRSLVAEAVISAHGFQQTDKDKVILFALPMHHAMGLVGVLLTTVYTGGTVIVVSGLSIKGVMETIERERGTLFMAVPYIYALMVDMAEKDGIESDLSSLRLWGSAGAPLSHGIIRRFKQHFGMDLIDFWGLTEAACHCTCPPVDGTGKFGSVGKVLSGWELKIVDDDGRALPVNQPGEIIVKGPIMKGYYNKLQATAEVVKDGWLYTGDIGRVDEDGYLFILGRKKEMIIQKGQNIYPGDIEAVLKTHPKIAETVVVGVPDELRGEIIRAYISLKRGEVATEEEIKHFCLEHMANYKVPKQIVFLESLPKTATGQIRKEDLNRLSS